MAKVIDLTNSDGDLVVLGRAIVLPNSTTDTQPHPLNGSIRFNPTLGAIQLFNSGSWVTLGSGSSGGGSSGSDNNHTHTVAQIIGLQNLLNGKAPLVHTHNMVEISGLSTALANKADNVHSHPIEQILGLRAELDSKASIAHTHKLTLPVTVSASFPGSPTANYRLVYTAASAMTFPQDLVGSVVTVMTRPAKQYSIKMLKNGATEVGSINIFPTGPIIVSAPAAFDLATGDTLSFLCPSRDTTIDSISFTLIANRPQLTIA